MKKTRIPTSDSEIFLVGEIYYYRGTPPGAPKQVEQTLKTSNFAEARKKKLDVITKHSRAGIKSGILAVGPLMDDHLKDRELEFLNGDIREETIIETRRILVKHLRPYFYRKKVTEIDEIEFLNYCEFKGKMDFSNHRKTMNVFLVWCRKKRLLKYTPKLEIPKWRRKQRQPLTESEIKSIFEHMDGNITLYVMMYLFMGMRNSEIIKLEWSRVDFEEKAIYLNEKNTKTKKARVLPINSKVLQVLVQRKSLSKSAFVFPNQRSKVGKTPHMHKGSFRKAWLTLLKKAGIKRDLTPHDLRATWEKYTNLNKDFTDVQREKMAGASIDIQRKTYVHLDVNDLRGLEEAVQVDGLYSSVDKILGKTTREKIIPLRRKMNNHG